jgi:hypothetical protein
MAKRRQSLSSNSPQQQHPMSPPSPATPKSLPATMAHFKSPSPPAPSPPEPLLAESTVVAAAAKGRPARVRRRDQEPEGKAAAKQGRRGRPRGSTGLKRKAKQVELDVVASAPKRSPELTIYKTDDAPHPCLPPLDSDALEWMDSSPSMLFDSHHSLFEVPLEDDNAGWSKFLKCFRRFFFFCPNT